MKFRSLRMKLWGHRREIVKKGKSGSANAQEEERETHTREENPGNPRAISPSKTPQKSDLLLTFRPAMQAHPSWQRPGWQKNDRRLSTPLEKSGEQLSSPTSLIHPRLNKHHHNLGNDSNASQHRQATSFQPLKSPIDAQQNPRLTSPHATFHRTRLRRHREPTAAKQHGRRSLRASQRPPRRSEIARHGIDAIEPELVLTRIPRPANLSRADPPRSSQTSCSELLRSRHGAEDRAAIRAIRMAKSASIDREKSRHRFPNT